MYDDVDHRLKIKTCRQRLDLLILLVVSAPVVALLTNRHWPVATNATRAVGLALPQVAIVPLMVRLAV